MAGALGQTLQPPPGQAAGQSSGHTGAKPPREAPARPPSPAPRVPVPGTKPTTPPVVKPVAGSSHAQKPAAAVAPTKPVEPPAAAVAAPGAAPAPAAKPEKTDEAGDKPSPKLPRFAALRSDEVNMRAGPGTRYPIQWTYRKRDLPVEIEREFEVWRLVRDIDGTRGWVHQATLTGRRNFIVKGGDATMRDAPKESGGAVAILKQGVIGRIRSCEANAEWCQVQTGSYRGYLKRDHIWGILPNEAVTP